MIGFEVKPVVNGIQGTAAPWRPTIDALRSSLRRQLRGKDQTIELSLCCLLARGHLLIEDLPGLGKTTLAKALALGIGGSFARVQCTPDLLPGDITGFNLFNHQTKSFEFMAGPVFTDVLLVDEINRATPRTQSALLEAMSERQVTVDNVRRPLADSFFVIATQNPAEHHGAYPLPEAQRDRFAMRLSIGYPDREDEVEILAANVGTDTNLPEREKPMSLAELVSLQDQVREIAVSRAIQEYIVDLGRAARGHREVDLGVSPRGLLIWQRTAQAWALLAGRGYVLPDDVLDVADPVLAVRLGVEAEACERVVAEILRSVAVPVYAKIE